MLYYNNKRVMCDLNQPNLVLGLEHLLDPVFNDYSSSLSGDELRISDDDFCVNINFEA